MEYINLDQFPEYVKCRLCRQILKDSRACPKCKKNFCQDCVFPWIKSYQECPHCNAFLYHNLLFSTDNNVKEMLSKVLVDDPFVTGGDSPQKISYPELLEKIEHYCGGEVSEIVNPYQSARLKYSSKFAPDFDQSGVKSRVSGTSSPVRKTLLAKMDDSEDDDYEDLEDDIQEEHRQARQIEKMRDILAEAKTRAIVTRNISWKKRKFETDQKIKELLGSEFVIKAMKNIDVDRANNIDTQKFIRDYVTRVADTS
mmetsp:Transcript_28910/g.33065  ORF Transcript_28910/g.33065 Transcript_28910/m.33065 type:complete len:255 (-) Transcript_28910:1485-2249(-)